jgi:hypothetical protein
MSTLKDLMPSSLYSGVVKNSATVNSNRATFMIPAPAEKKKVEMYSRVGRRKYFQVAAQVISRLIEHAR